MSSVAYTFLHRVVRNDAIKLDPPQIYNWRVFALAAAVSVFLPRAAIFTGALFRTASAKARHIDESSADVCCL